MKKLLSLGVMTRINGELMCKLFGHMREVSENPRFVGHIEGNSHKTAVFCKNRGDTLWHREHGLTSVIDDLEMGGWLESFVKKVGILTVDNSINGRTTWKILPDGRLHVTGSGNLSDVVGYAHFCLPHVEDAGVALAGWPTQSSAR